MHAHVQYCHSPHLRSSNAHRMGVWRCQWRTRANTSPASHSIQHSWGMEPAEWFKIDINPSTYQSLLHVSRTIWFHFATVCSIVNGIVLVHAHMPFAQFYSSLKTVPIILVPVWRWSLITRGPFSYTYPTECFQEEDESSDQLETVDGVSLFMIGNMKSAWRKRNNESRLYLEVHW